MITLERVQEEFASPECRTGAQNTDKPTLNALPLSPGLLLLPPDLLLEIVY
jgi:hypothetical protein